MNKVEYKAELGQVFTKGAIADYMISLLETPKTGKVLDPCFGGGAFVEAFIQAGYNNITGYEIDCEWCSRGEEMYPDILFAKDGEIYNFDGLKTVVIGGAYSVDKWHRLHRRYKWWHDEQPSPSIREYVESQLEKADWTVDIVLSHTSPVEYEPVEVFLSGIDPRTVDKSTELWLQQIKERLTYKKWFCGHFHTEKVDKNVEFLFDNYRVLK